jgi:hypothetical protein
MGAYAFAVGDVVVLVGQEDVALTIIEVDGERIGVGWFADGAEFRSTSLPTAALRPMVEELELGARPAP